MIRFTCGCGKAYQLKDELAGKKVKCPACQAVMIVPAPAASASLLEPLSPGGLGPLGGLPPLGTNDFSGGLPSLSPPAPVGMPQPGLAPMGLGPSPLAGPATGQPAASGPGIPPLVWIVAAISGAVAVVIIVGVVVAISLTPRGRTGPVAAAPTTANAMHAAKPIDPAAIAAAKSGAPGSVPLVTRDARGRGVIGTEAGVWQTYSSEEGGYTIRMPGKPTLVPQSTPVPGGKVEGMVAIVGSDAAGSIVIASHLNMPFDASVLPLDNLIQIQMAQQGAKVSRTSDVQVSGRPGKEFAVEVPDMGGVPGKGVFRCLIVGSRYYAMGYLARNDRYDESHAMNCLNSFTITKEPQAASASQLPGVNPPITQAVQWTPYDFTRHGAKVEFPAAPTTSGDQNDPGQGISHQAMCNVAGKGAFGVVAQFPPVPLTEAGLAPTLEALKKVLAAKKRNVVSESVSKQGNFHVLDMVVDEISGARSAIRVFYAVDRNFLLSWSGPPDQQASPEVDRFFRSFAITMPMNGAATP